MGPLSPPAPPPFPDPEGCCLELHETLVVLVSLILLIQVALQLLAQIGCSLCQLSHSFCAQIIAKECEKLRPAPVTVRRSHSRKHLGRWSESDVSSQKRCSRCVHYTLVPLKLTMDVQSNEQPNMEPHRVGRRPYPDYPPYEFCECEHYHQATSSPAVPTVTRYRDVACGTSDPMFFSGNTPGPVTEPYPRTQVREKKYQDLEYPAGAGTRTCRPTKVYIYPVHPQTPPGSRSPSVERVPRRRGAVTEEASKYEVREQRRRSPRESAMPVTRSPGLTRVAGQIDIAQSKARTTWTDLAGGSDWVYRPLK